MHYRAPSKPFRTPHPLVAARLIPKQLIRKPANLKNATLDIDRSSWAVREDAKMSLRSAGVIGKRVDLDSMLCVGSNFQSDELLDMSPEFPFKVS